jgi:hypothetical protein
MGGRKGFSGLAKVILTGEPVAAGLRAGGGERNYFPHEIVDECSWKKNISAERNFFP